MYNTPPPNDRRRSDFIEEQFRNKNGRRNYDDQTLSIRSGQGGEIPAASQFPIEKRQHQLYRGEDRIHAGRRNDRAMQIRQNHARENRLEPESPSGSVHSAATTKTTSSSAASMRSEPVRRAAPIVPPVKLSSSYETAGHGFPDKFIQQHHEQTTSGASKQQREREQMMSFSHSQQR